MRQVDEILARVGTAVDQGRWADALETLDAAGEAARTPELLELRSRAAYGHGDFEASVRAWEELHELLRASGDPVGAARAAAMAAMFLMIDSGLMAPVRGWLRRADQLLEDEAEGPADAVIAAARTYERFMCGEVAAAHEQAERAVELGRRHDVQAAEVIGRTAGARLAILDARVEEGVAQLEEIAALLLSGAVDPLTTGMMLCELVCAAQGLARHDLASEWTLAMDRWRPGAAFGGLHGRCRVHRAEILRVTGPCDAAEDEALGACDDLRPWMRREFGWPLAELGTIRLRKGDLAGAQEALVAAHEHVWCPHPGLAMLRLEQGRVAEAAELIEDAITHPFLVPSKERPPSSDLTLAPLLEAQVEIAVAAGAVDTAREAAAGLRRVADRFGSPWLEASAVLAEARVSLADGDTDAATAAGGHAVAAWADLGAPFEAAVARTVLAEAKERAGRSAGAQMEWEAAARAFDDYGARRRAEMARSRLGGPVAVAPPAAAEKGSAVFRREGDTRLIEFAGSGTSMRDLKGFRYLARMMADPGREFHVLDLVAVEQGTLPTGSPAAVGQPELTVDDAAGIPVLDDAARADYRRRLADVEDDLADALACNDPARAELAEQDREFLVAELARAVGLGGRLRRVGSDAERARTAVTRTLRYSLERLAEHHADLAGHLEISLHTGTYCAYRPDPMSAVEWRL